MDNQTTPPLHRITRWVGWSSIILWPGQTLGMFGFGVIFHTTPNLVGNQFWLLTSTVGMLGGAAWIGLWGYRGVRACRTRFQARRASSGG